MIELRQQLEKERSVRMILEDQVMNNNKNRHNKGTKTWGYTVSDVLRSVATHTLFVSISCQMRSLDAQLYPEKLKAIAQQFQEQQAQTQSLVCLQQEKQLERDFTPAHSPQVHLHLTQV